MNVFLLLAIPLTIFIYLYRYLESMNRPKLSFIIFWGGLGTFTLALLEGVFVGFWPQSWHFIGIIWHFFMHDFFYFIFPILFVYIKKLQANESRSDFLFKTTLLLGIVFTVLGSRDFIMTRPHFTDIELFMKPVARILFAILTPFLLQNFLSVRSKTKKVFWGSAIVGLAAFFSLLMSLRVMNWGLWVWIATALAVVGTFFYVENYYRNNKNSR